MSNRAQRRSRGQRGPLVEREDPREVIARADKAAEAKRAAEQERNQRLALITARSRGLWLPGDD